MPEYRTDPIAGHTVIIVPGRQSRPGALALEPWPTESAPCPFCRGKEGATPQEVYALPDDIPKLDWQVRVVPNLYPAFQVEPAAEVDANFAVGRHEVVIESPNHEKSITPCSPAHIAMILQAYAHRISAMSRLPDIVYALVFKNHGPAAGATLQHTHSQVVGMNRVPDVIERERKAAADYFAAHGQCIFCQLIDHQIAQQTCVVAETDDWIVFCPSASRLPYEMCLMPKRHAGQFSELDLPSFGTLANLLREVLARLENLFPNIAYNYVIHTQPFDTNPHDHYHWHIEIIPRLATPAGFEWGTGVFLNPVPAEQAARDLRRGSC